MGFRRLLSGCQVFTRRSRAKFRQFKFNWEARNRMKLVEKLAFMGGVTFLAAGCAAFGGGYPSGSIYSGTTVPHGVDRLEMAGQAKTGDKSGEACATGILNLAA